MIVLFVHFETSKKIIPTDDDEVMIEIMIFIKKYYDRQPIKQQLFE